MIDPGLRNKVVLVTGANNPFGIGAAIAEAFAAQGAAIFMTYLAKPAGSIRDRCGHGSGSDDPGRAVLPGSQRRSARRGARPAP